MHPMLSSGPAQVIGTGTATTFFGHPLVLTAHVEGNPIEVRLRFLPSETVTVETLELAHGYQFDCHGFTDDVGRGSAQPVLIGTFGDELIFFHFRAMRYGASIDTTVHYTFYRATKADVGWQPTTESSDV